MIKQYRNFKSYPLIEIQEKFAFFPKIIKGNFVFLKRYYQLNEIQAFSFRGQLSVWYESKLESFSIFEFKSFLKDKGIIKNIYKEKKEMISKLNDPRAINLKKLLLKNKEF